MPEEKRSNEAEEAYISEQLQQLHQQLNLLKQEQDEINAIVESINEISKLKNGDKMLASVGGGVFVQVSIGQTNELFVNIGGSVVAKKDLKKTKEGIEKQAGELRNYAQEVEKEMAKLVLTAKALRK